MWIDEQTRSQLHLEEILADFEPLTPYGKKERKNLKPFLPGEEERWLWMLNEQEKLQSVGRTFSEEFHKLERICKQFPDITSILELLSQSRTPALTDWFHLKRFLWLIQEWMELLSKHERLTSFLLSKEEIEIVNRLLWRLNPSPSLQPSFAVEDAYDERLKNARKRLRQLEVQKQKEREESIQQLESKYNIRPNRLGEWVIDRKAPVHRELEGESQITLIRETMYEKVYELSRPNLEQAQEDELKQQIEERVQLILQQLAHQFMPHLSEIQQIVEKLTHFDLLWARVRLATTWNGVKPEWDVDHFVLDQGVHPVVERYLHQKELSFTPIDLHIYQGVSVIIGPNMGGKTVAIKTVGMITALAQLGFFVPATRCRMPLFPWIATVIGDDQQVEKGLSSFGAEVIRLGTWLEKKKQQGLLLLDEIGRGTNPIEGASLSFAITDYLSRSQIWTLHVTHYQELMSLKHIQVFRVAGLPEEVYLYPIEKDPKAWISLLHQRMDYRLVPVKEQDQFPEQAISIAKMLGLHADIVKQAQQLVKSKRGEE
ncbi:MutS-related protein [Hazenella coriacea]|uniref:MutS-like protein n=1 Tax=Hazenella coriacea TaxID=1179467 RepID=A0A4R3L8N6_9BACL|nr:hypothetical protein [Hazenella coriacea]TCS95538.1 MutS-like protein [Hazenella coriacea]